MQKNVLMGLGLMLTTGAVANAETPGQEGFIEEVVVVARQRAESLGSVPDTINAFTEGDIEARGIDSIGDVALAIPNFTVIPSQNAGTVNLNVRGIGQARNGEPPVAVVIDGVQTSSVNQIARPLFDIRQIEVLKGPQGAIYGRNALGGALVITTKEPSNEAEGFAFAGIGKGDFYEVGGGMSGPLVEDKVFFRISGQVSDFNGLLDNQLLNKNVDFNELTDLRGRLVFTPTDTVKADIRISHFEVEQGAEYYIAHYQTTGFGPLPINDAANDQSFEITADEIGRGTLESLEVSGKLEFELDFATFIYIIGSTDTSESYGGDLDFTYLPIARVDQSFDIESLSHEIRLTSSSDQAFRWIVGGYLLDTDRKVISSPALNSGLGFVAIVSDEDNENSTVAGFGQASYDLNDRLEITVGGRYDRDERKQRSTTSSLLFPAPIVEDRKDTFSSFQPKVSFGYDVSDDILVFATVGAGFRSGGFNTDSVFGTPTYEESYDKEEIVSYEVGFKARVMERKFSVNGAVFYNDHSNQQLYQLASDGIPPFSRPVQAVFNIDESRSLGIELETVWTPGEQTTIGIAGGWIDVEITDFNGTTLYDGNRTPLTPEYSYSLFAAHTLFVGEDLPLTLRADYSGQSGLVWFFDNVDEQSSYSLLGARATLEFKNCSVVLYGENLLDEEYYTEFAPVELSGLPADIGWPGTPQRYGLKFKVRF